MKRLKQLFYLVLAVGIVFTGCATNNPNSQSVTQMVVWKDYAVSEEYLDFYDGVSVAIGEVNTQEGTALVTVTIPNLEKYLRNEDASEESGQMLELEFPVQQVDGEWQIASMEPLREYIRNESTRILIEMMEKSGGVTIDFDPQGGME